MNERPILVASNVLINDLDEVLLGLRVDGKGWEVPGGKVERETVELAGRREMMEETGIVLLGEPKVLGFSQSCFHNSPDKPWHVCFMLLWPNWHGTPALVEGKHLEWKWFSLRELPPLTQMTYGTQCLFSVILPGFIDMYIGFKATKN